MIFLDSNCNDNKNDIEIERICQTAIRFIGISNKTSGRVIQYLQKKGYENDLIETVIDQLIERSYIDDLKVARKMIRLRGGRKSVAAKAHRYYLMSAGVCKESVEEAIKELPADEQTAPRALNGKYANVIDYKTESMIRFLCGRGYSVDVARKTVDNFMNMKKTEHKR